MDQTNGIYFIYGLCVMFYAMMAWVFWRKGADRLSRLVAMLMALIGAQCVKDVWFLADSSYGSEEMWTVMTAIDMVAVPLYAFILMELCRPGMLTAAIVVWHTLPVVALPALYIATGARAFYLAEVAWVAVYGVAVFAWTVVAIRRYNTLLREQFSYEENINLGWLRVILYFFFAILGLWILDCVQIDVSMESLYMLSSLVMWAFLAYFIYRHESVIGELKAAPCERVAPEEESAMASRIAALFEVERVYLNPNLKLADIAAMVGSNRTYVSRFFNSGPRTSFFDYVNSHRVGHAQRLLAASDEKLEAIAEQSGFNSRQSFHRVFSKLTGVTPEKYRANPTPPISR